MNWNVVYDLEKEVDLIKQIQKVSLDEKNPYGVSPLPYLFGSKSWWDAILNGNKAISRIEGKIGRVSWESMGDWPAFDLVEDSGNISHWTREGNFRKYVEGLAIRVEFTEERTKQQPKAPSGEIRKRIIKISIENSSLRASGIAPGPGGAGYELEGGTGSLIHFFEFDDFDKAESLSKDVLDLLVGHGTDGVEGANKASSNRKPHIWKSGEGLWMLRVNRGKVEPNLISTDINRAQDLALRVGGRYDGSESIGHEPVIYEAKASI